MLKDLADEVSPKGDTPGEGVLAAYFREARERADLSRGDLSRLIGRAPVTIQQWELGKNRIPVEYMIVASLIFEDDPTAIMGLAEPMDEDMLDRGKCNLADWFEENPPDPEDNYAYEYIGSKRDRDKRLVRLRDAFGNELVFEVIKYGEFAVYISETRKIRFATQLNEIDTESRVREFGSMTDAAAQINEDTSRLLRSTISNRLLCAREDRGVARSKLAEALGITVFTLASYEARKSDDRTSIPTQTAIAAALLLETEPMYLFGLESSTGLNIATSSRLWFEPVYEGWFTKDGLVGPAAYWYIGFIGHWGLLKIAPSLDVRQFGADMLRRVCCDNPKNVFWALEIASKERGLEIPGSEDIREEIELGPEGMEEKETHEDAMASWMDSQLARL